MFRLIVITILFFPLILCAEDFSRNLKFNRINSKNGLSHNSVHDILRDSKGFMWFATEDGLNRYDGYKFKIYKNRFNCDNCLSDNFIYDLFQTNEGKIWIATNSNGIDVFNPETEVFFNFNSEDISSGLTSNKIRKIQMDKDENIWVGTYGGGVNFYDKNSGSFRKFDLTTNSSPNKDFITDIFCDSKNNLWIATEGAGVFIYSIQNDVFKNFNTDTFPFNISDNEVTNIFEDTFNNIWIGTKKGLNLFSQYENSILKFTSKNSTLSYDYIQTIMQDDLENLWIGTGNGLNLFNYRTKKFSVYLNNPLNNFSISNNSVISFYESDQGIFWIGTAEGGVNKLNREANKFQFYSHIPGITNSLSYSIARSFFAEDSENLWIGTNLNGINKLNINTGEITLFNEVKFGIGNHAVTTIFIDSKNRVWAGTWDNGLFVSNSKKNVFFRKFKDLFGFALQDEFIQLVYEDSKGLFWIGTNKGLSYFDENTSKLNLIPGAGNGNNNISNNEIQSKAFIEDNEGNYWVGTWNGLNKIKLIRNNLGDSIHVEKFFSDNKNVNGLSDNRIISLLLDSKNILWIGTYGGGLNKLDLNKNKMEFESVSLNLGISNQVVYTILEDSFGKIWFSTNNGLVSLSPDSNYFRVYNEGDGLQGNIFFWGAGEKISDKLVFGGTNGINIFDPSSLKGDPYLPPVAITEASIMQLEFNKFIGKNPNYINSIELDHNHNNLSFEFSALHFSNPEKNNYKYKLEGLETEWNNVGAERRFVNYTNLEPGTYLLKIIASNPDGLWNSEGISLNIIINPPFYSTLWFRILTVILLTGLIFLIIYIREYRLRNNKILLEKQISIRTEELKEANLTKDKFFSIIAHDLRNPFNSLLGLTEILKEDYYELSEEEKIDYITEISNASNTLHELLENLLTWSRSQSGKIEFLPKVININEALKNSISVFKHSAEIKKINIVLEVENDFVYFDSNMLDTVFRNIISNSIKFTEIGGEILIYREYSDKNFIIIVIEDNGIGMDSETLNSLFLLESVNSRQGTNQEKGTGLGLIIIKDFIELNGGKIEVESEVNKGTKFKVYIPRKDKL